MGKDGKIRIFRVRDNALRINRPHEVFNGRTTGELFEEMVLTAVKKPRFVPPYESGASFTFVRY